MTPDGSPTIYKTFRSYDPAFVDLVDPPVIGEYALHRDPAVLALPDDCQPTVFHYRLLTRAQRKRIGGMQTQEDRYELAFRFGVMLIDFPPGADPRGRTLDFTMARQRPDAPLEDAAIDNARLSDVDLWEIGAVVYHHSTMALGTPLRVPQLGSSLHAWAAVRFRPGGPHWQENRE